MNDDLNLDDILNQLKKKQNQEPEAPETEEKHFSDTEDLFNKINQKQPEKPAEDPEPEIALLQQEPPAMVPPLPEEAQQPVLAEGMEELPQPKKKLPWYKRLYRYFIPLRTDSTGEKIRKAVFLVALVVFIGATAYVCRYFYESYMNDHLVINIAKKYDKTVEIPDEQKREVGYPVDYLDSFFELYKQNSDVKGYLKVNGTKIDFPVVQARDNDFYLRRDFLKNKNDHGIPFIEAGCTVNPLSTNTIIYGHNMKDGQMFADFLKYQQLDFYKAHPLIKFDTVYEESEWKVFAAFMANAEEAQGPVFKYHQFINAKDEEEFNSFIQEVMLRSFIKTTVDITPEDKLLTLSTCDYSIPEGRFVVMARKVRKGESKRVDTEGAEANELPMYPEAWYTTNNVSMPDFSNLSSQEEVSSEEPPAEESSGDVTQPSEQPPPPVSSEEPLPPPIVSEEPPPPPPAVSEEPEPPPPVSSEEPLPPPVVSEEPPPPPASEEPEPPPVNSEEPPPPSQASEEPPAVESQEPAPENIEQ